MKTKFLTAVVTVFGIFGQCATAQTNDIYPVLRTLDGNSYTNVEVVSATPTHLTVFFDGGGTRIAFTNLSQEIQKKYKFDPALAAAAASAEAAKRLRSSQDFQQQQAQTEQRINWRGETVKAHVLSINMAVYEFKLSTKGVEKTVTFFNMPMDVTDFLDHINAVRNNLDNLTAANRSQRQYAAAQRAIADATEHFRDDASLNPNYPGQQAEANLAEARAREQRTQIAELTTELARLRSEEVKKTTILARPTGRFYGHQVWEFVSMPSEDGTNASTTRQSERGR